MSMRKWLRERLGGLADEILGFLVLIVLLPALYEWIRGNPETAWRFGLLALVVMNILLTWVGLRSEKSPQATTQTFRQEGPEQLPTAILVREAESGRQYFLDKNVLFREIPDDNTFSYLENVLGIEGDLPTVTADEIIRRSGKAIPVARDYKRPLTPEEIRKKQVERQIRQMLLEERFYIYETDPQQITIEFANTGDEALYLRRAEFMPLVPSQAMLHHSNRTDSNGILSLLRDGKNLGPGEKYSVGLRLAAKWEPGSLERLANELGFLNLCIQFKGEEIALMYTV
jgi:hypothetical protein